MVTCSGHDKTEELLTHSLTHTLNEIVLLQSDYTPRRLPHLCVCSLLSQW
jgi:hypothetical protein